MRHKNPAFHPLNFLNQEKSHLRFRENSGQVRVSKNQEIQKFCFFWLQSNIAIHTMREVVDFFEMNLDNRLGSVLVPFVMGQAGLTSAGSIVEESAV